MILSILSILNPVSWVKKGVVCLRRPRLEIYYDPDETYHQALDIGFNRVLGNFAHVMVRNNGKNVARNCIGELRRIEVLKETRFQNVREYRHIMKLKWAHEKDFASKDIEPDIPRRLDVCYIHKGYDTVHFFTEKYPSGNRTDFPPGEYKIKIKVKSDNAKGVEKEFIVKYDAGKFDSLVIDNF